MMKATPRGLPVWARKDFRKLVTIAVMGLAVLAVLVFRIGPMLNSTPVPAETAAEPVEPASWATESPVAGKKVADRVPLDRVDETHLELFRKAVKEGISGAEEVDYRLFGK